jgi:hypothetical protein
MSEVEKLVSYYEKGNITHYELFATVREKGMGDQLPERFRKDFEEWDKEHPADKCVTFCIRA